MHLVFWQNILSPHQAPYLRALAEAGHEVTIVTTEAMTDDRRALGWKLPDHGQARILVAPTEGEVRKLIAGGDPAVIHIIAGARWTPLGNLASRLCRASGRRLGIISESADPRGVFGYGRRIKYTLERLRHGRGYQFVFAMGEMGVNWFMRSGFSRQKTFPFAYVTAPLQVPTGGDSAGDLTREIAILYCGQFIHRKGLDLLLRAFAAEPASRTTLRLLGDGPQQAQLQALAKSLGITDHIVWLAKRDAAGVQMEMAKADLTVLSSRHDGWGAVVNESLMVGTPVICTDACGAADLIRQPWRGTVVRAGSVEHLSRAIKGWMDRGSTSAAERERIRQWATCINGESVAQYFVAVMEHVYMGAARPVAPWRD